MTRRAQIAGRLLIILLSWAALILALAVMFILQTYTSGSSNPPLRAVTSPDIDVTLSSYLRTSVTNYGETSPLAEALVSAVMDNRLEPIVKQHTERFLSQLNTGTFNRIRITRPDGNEWAYGHPGSIVSYDARAILPLPDGRTFTVTYEQVTAEHEADPTAHMQGGGI